MMATTKLHDLIALAQEPSSDRRRELLREVTDLFFVGVDGRQPSELALFDDVLSQLAGEMEEAVRAELAERMADVAQPPPKLIGRFTSDTVAVAEPVLTRSPALPLTMCRSKRALSCVPNGMLTRRHGRCGSWMNERRDRWC